MFQTLKATTKNRREYLTKLYESLNAAVYGYGGAVVTPVGKKDDSNQMLSIRLVKETMDLKRFLKLPFVSQYLYKPGQPTIKLTDVPQDASGSSMLFQTSAPWSNSVQVRFRKGEKNDKDLFIEVWRSEDGRGFVSSRKVSEKVTKIYNDAVFGSASWSRDETKIVFVGEKPEPASYKNYWEDEQPKKDEEDKKEKEEGDKKAEEEKPDTKYLDEKYKYVDDFGETLVGKKRPSVFIFDLVENTLSEVLGLPESDFFPTFPVFDESSKGLVFAGINSPFQKLGMNFCLNRVTRLYHVREPVFDKKKLPEDKSEYMKCLNNDEFMSINPKFSDDFTKLLYMGTKDKFISHTGNFQLRYLSWPITSDSWSSKLVIDKVKGYPKSSEQEFAGIYGYNQSLISMNFIGTSNRFAVFESPFKAQHRVYLVDLETNEVKWLNFLNKEGVFDGDYELQKVYQNNLIIRYSAYSQPTQIFAVTFEGTEAQSIKDLKYQVTLLEEVKFNLNNLIEKEIAEFLPTIKKETIALDNGAEGHFVFSEKFKGEKRPMVTIIHGGPFGCAPQDMFLQMRTFLLLQGYSLLILNYTGSTSYGEDFLNNLLGAIGDKDVHDCGQLIKKAISQFSDIVDSTRVATYGASHGGFMTGWLIGHPDYKDLFGAAVLWNPVINMSYMYSSTDIPDWILACCLNKDWSYKVSSNDNQTFFEKSPISVVSNVKTPSLVLIGGSDKRVPPHQGYQYHHMLRSQGVKSKLYNYPEDGHSIASSEPSIDATMNIFFWFDEHFNKDGEEPKKID